MINARAETITETPSYRRLVESKCCLIPTDGFMNGAEKETARLPPGFTFGLCGGTLKTAKANGCYSLGEVVHTFTIITTECFDAPYSQPYASRL